MGIDQDYVLETVKKIHEGVHRCRIKQAEKLKSRSGNDMIVVEIELYGYQTTLKHYITFLPDRPQFASRMISQMFESFPSISGTKDTSKWAGAVGACEVVYEEYGGMMKPKISRMVPAEYQQNLPIFGTGIYVYDDQVLVPSDGKTNASFEELIRLCQYGSR